VRINYIQEYGNYGYLDEYTGAHWSAPRTGMHDSIPKRHWHQNDPGVVPNMLITGAGSPAGITVYEGDLLPEVFRGQIIHADAGPNVVRAYPVTPEGAGFQAGIKDILTSPYDQWFRPVDVAVAPDGSLFVADWYDPIVGGAAAGDREKGRIFRIAPPDTEYAVAATDLTTLDGAIAGLQSPNESVRYLAWQTLHEAGNAAEAQLKYLWENGSDRMRARALWLLGQLPEQGTSYVSAALEDPSGQIRITGLRLARQLGMDVPDVGLALVEDKSARVRAESAIGLRNSDHPDAAGMWAILAEQHDGKDRWYLEALGIGADPHWKTFFESWLHQVGEDWNTPGGREIVWRSRAPAAAVLLADLIVDPQTTAPERLRYFRAFDFHRGDYKNEALLSLLEKEHAEQDAINALVLQHLDTKNLKVSPQIKQALETTLADLKGSWQYVELVEKFDLRNKKQELLDLAASTNEEAATAAARLLTDPETFAGTSLIKDRIAANEEEGLRLIRAIQSTGRPQTFKLLQEITWDDHLSPSLQKAAIQAMAQTWTGEDYLLKSVMDERFPDALKPLAASVLFSVYRTSIHEEAARYLERPANAEQKELPPIRVLVATVGNAEKGKAIFEVQCKICHRVRQEGINFGPDLSQIGSKLDKEGLYRSILYPNEGVSYGYETYKLSLQSGTVVVGLPASETEEAIDLKLTGGQVQTYAKSEIASKEQMTNSMMPNLALVLEEEQLVDLVAYLSTLK
jgi:putative heme-binding domain-containing protein